jgi:glycosyltransferase involved in cell wall biosynthesis
MIKLSATIITLNEEKNIARCLESLQQVADEIVVLDSYSTDQTEEICKKYGTRFISHPFENYVAQKNEVAQQASHNFILSIDADEVLSEKLIHEILKIKKNPLADAYTFSRLNNFCGTWIKHAGWYPDKKLRIYDRTKGRWTGLKIHEKIEMDSGSLVKHVSGDLYHYTFHSITQHIETINKFSTIVAQERLEKGKKTSILRILFKPVFKFMQMYFVKLGFLDGFYGFVVCINSAHSTFLKEIKLKELLNHKKNA